MSNPTPGADRYRAAEAAFWSHHGAPEPTEHWIDVAAHDIRVRVLEAGSGRPVLFVHGGPNAGSTFAPLVAGMADDARCLVLDRPGCGLSEPLDYSDVRPAGIAELMVDVMLPVLGSLTDGPVDVVGSSFGGSCVLWLADAHPELVRRIAIEGIPAIDGMKMPMNQRMIAIGPLGRFIARRKASVADIQRTFKQIGHTQLVESGWPEGPDREWGLSMMNDTDTMRNEVALIQRGTTWRGFKPGLLPPETLARIDKPTLWLAGGSDTFASVDMVRGWVDLMPSAELEVQQDSGHLPWIDDSPYHAKRISEFFAADSG